MDEQHHIEIKEGNHTYQAYCSCGYQGREWRFRRDANEDGDEHVIGLSHG